MNEEVKEQPIPWVERKEIGFLKSLWATIKFVLLKPAEFFDNVEVERPLLEPFSFYFIITLALGIGHVIRYAILHKNFLISASASFIIVPIFLVMAIFTIFIYSAIAHLFVILFKGEGGFKATFNILVYSAAANIFTIVPFVGSLITGVWGSMLVIIGYKRIHKFSTAKAIMVYLGPMIIPAFVVLLAAVSIPNLLKARLTANEAAAEARVKTISMAIETYTASHQGNYPSDELVLKYATPPYLPDSYNNKTIQGYDYSLNLDYRGYEIVAAPSKCGITGNKVFKAKTGGTTWKEGCK